MDIKIGDELTVDIYDPEHGYVERAPMKIIHIDKDSEHYYKQNVTVEIIKNYFDKNQIKFQRTINLQKYLDGEEYFS